MPPNAGKFSPVRDKARRALNLSDDVLLLSVAAGTLGVPALYDLTHNLAPGLLDELPNLQIHHESGLYGSVDITADADPRGLAPMSQRSLSESEDAADEAARHASTPAPQTAPSPAAATTSSAAPGKATDSQRRGAARSPARRNANLLPDRYLEVPFFEHRDAQLAASDLVLSRSGANDCAQLMAAGVPSVLVPAPLAVDSHEHFNAVAMRAAGAAEVAPAAQSEVDEDGEDGSEEEEAAARHEREAATARLLITILSDEKRRSAMAQAARSSAGNEAARVTAQALIALAKDSKNRDIAVLRPFVELPPAVVQSQTGVAPSAA